MKNIAVALLIISALSISACKTPYTPAPITATNNFLVVEGLININDSTYINLSRTVNISAKSTVKPEIKATITIESNTGNNYPLKELGNGVYSAASYNLSASNQYRLRIKTTSGSVYTSDFAPTKVTPPIDSVVTNMKPDGLYIGINAHDATNNTRYYRWDFAETWQFTSFFQSLYTGEGAATSPITMSPFNPGIGITVLPRTNDIYHCWGNNTSHLITLNTTAGLSQDILLNSPLTFVASSSEKLSVRYSILVKQYALSKDGYDYWTLLKKNTEQLGSLFDSQPSASIGNLHNINNPSEPVIGFISASTVSQQRIYIDYTQLPKSYIADYLNNNPYNPITCQLDVIPIAYLDKFGNLVTYGERDYFVINYPFTSLIPINLVGKVNLNVNPPMGSHSGASPICADCTLRGANVKPTFWK